LEKKFGKKLGKEIRKRNYENKYVRNCHVTKMAQQPKKLKCFPFVDVVT
jgi:hypothetical protein